VEFFQKKSQHDGLPAAFAVVTFGPVDLRDPASPGYGAIMKTPKAGWEGAHWLNPLREAFPDRPLFVDTDVNGAAFGELTWGAGQGLSDLIYITVGTGIGGGVIAGGRPVHGLLHPEIGHIRFPRNPDDDFAGVCPFHGDCLEGLASGPALKTRWGQPAESLPSDHPAWSFHADYLARACANLACTVSPQRIILGGGVMQQDFLFPMIRERLLDRLNGYLDVPEITEQIDRYLVPPGLGQDAGLLGAVALAQHGLKSA
jgi:fructokinase